jgi:hypothetical protein
MDAVPAAVRQARTDMAADFDAIVIGAGISGFYQLYKLRELGQRRASTANGIAHGSGHPARGSHRPAFLRCAGCGNREPQYHAARYELPRPDCRATRCETANFTIS